MSSVVAGAGLPDPVFDAQSIFRATLDAMAHPGTIVTLGAAPPKIGALAPAANGVLLTLADATTPVWLAPSFESDEIAGHLRFQCGSPIVPEPIDAARSYLDTVSRQWDRALSRLKAFVED